MEGKNIDCLPEELKKETVYNDFFQNRKPALKKYA